MDSISPTLNFGSGTANFLAKWVTASLLGPSIMSEAGTVVTVGGSLLATGLTVSGLTSGLIPQAGVSGLLANSALGTSGITGTLTLSKSGSTARTVTFPDTAIVVAGSAAALTSGLIPQAGASGILANSALGTSGITGTLTLSKSGSTARTVTFPDAAITVAGLSLAQSWSGIQTFAAASTIMGTDPGGSLLLRVGGGVRIGAVLNGAIVALTDAASIATDAALANMFTVTLGSNRTLANPTNLVSGSTYVWQVAQDATGGRTLAYGSAFKWSGAAAPTLSTAATAVDVITAVCVGANLYATISKGLSPAIAAGTPWTIRTSAADNNWRAVAYGNGLFVAVSISGTGNRVMTSPNGTTWTIRTSAADINWRAVTYGNGLFVAVAISGTGNRVMTSPDGITWTIRTSAADNDWSAVTYGNGLFVAVSTTGISNRVMTSPDGITWTIRATAGNDWRAVTYGNGLFVAVATTGTGNRVMTSPDGITWTNRTSAADNEWYGVTYGDGLFVAVAATGTGNRVMTSPDGTTWTIRTSAADNSWYGITYGNGLFVATAISSTGNRVMTSPDGTTWTIRTSAADNSWYGLIYGNGLFVAVSDTGTGNRVMTSLGDLSAGGGFAPFTSGLIPQAGVGGLLADSALSTSGITGTLTLSKSGTTARTATFPDAAITVAGSAAALTSGLIPQAGASGILADSAFGTSGITNTLTLSKSGSTARTATFPDAAITVAGLSLAQSWSGIQTFAAASTIMGTDPGGGEMLRVGGSARLNGNVISAPASGDPILSATRSTGEVAIIAAISGTGYIGTQSNHPVAFATNNTVRATITAAGSMVIGTEPGGSDLFRIGGALTINSTRILSTKTSFTNGAAAAAGTLTNAPAAGNPTKWIPIDDNGTTRHIPAW